MNTDENSLPKEPQRTYKRPQRFELDYVTDGLHESVDGAHKAVQWLLNDIVQRQAHLRRWVSLLGASGSGKTHLAKAALRALRANGYEDPRAQLWTWRRAFERMMESSEATAWLIKRPVLIIDDVGAAYTGSDRSRQMHADKLLELLEGRLGKWTLITSNLSEGDFAEVLDVRIASRLYRGLNVIVDMSKADDYGVIAYDKRNGKS